VAEEIDVTSHAEGPFFSVIIPTLNSATSLEASLESVSDQHCKDVEVIVSDGASSDATLEIARGYGTKLGALTVLSRPDEGVYDAINRAIAVARGRWVYVLGSDDRLHAATVLSRVREDLTSAREPLVYGDVIIRGKSALGGDGERYAGPFTMRRLLTQNICQQAIFYRRELFDRIGGFDPRYRIIADWHFSLRVFSKYPARWIDTVVCDFAGGGLSSGASGSASPKDYPDVLLRLFVASPMHGEFTAVRWVFYNHAVACWRERRVLRSARFHAASAWLGVRERLPFSRSGESPARR
jgi:glycosyltransferase involved in cell wall biosynthesis